jgi:hypothetical protein
MSNHKHTWQPEQRPGLRVRPSELVPFPIQLNYGSVMKVNTLIGMVGLAILMSGSIVVGEELVSYTDLVDRLETLEYELAAFQKDGKGDGCIKCDYDDCCGCPTTYASYEMTVLRPYISNITAPGGFDNEYGVGHRFIIGRDNGHGLGVRLRYWMYNHGHALVPPAPMTLNIDMDAVDLEATLKGEFCSWDLTLAGGIRYGRSDFSFGPSSLIFEGTGPTVSLEAARDVGGRGLYLVGNFRASMLIGEIDNPAGVGGAPLVIDDELDLILENQLGVGYAREMGRAELHVRALWETQFWMNDTIQDPAGIGFGSHLGLSGATFAVEARL